VSSSKETFASSEAAWSLDGTKIAFTNGSIYVVNEDGSNLTNLNQFGTHPSWAPNGTKIAFGNGGIWVMNADGSNQIYLNRTGGDASWAPDGSKIAFQRNSQIYTIDANGSNEFLVSDTTFANTDPDWRWSLSLPAPTPGQHLWHDRLLLESGPRPGSKCNAHSDWYHVGFVRHTNGFENSPELAPLLSS
jgi:dipeptidyl aminopeptidase/acylaminoacyl peptidase